MIILPKGTIIRNTSGMSFGKYSVPENVYLVITSDPDKDNDYVAKVINYKKDPLAICEPRLGFSIFVSDYLINNFFEVVSRLSSNININKIKNDISYSCEIKTISKTKKSIYKKIDSDVIFRHNLYAGHTLYYKSLNMYFRIHGNVKSFEGGFVKWNISMYDKNKLYNMVFKGKKITITHRNKKLISLKLDSFARYFDVIKRLD